MNSENRRREILDHIIRSSRAIKGLELANIFGVTRQVIVKDVAIIRASGVNIIATPEGYIVTKDDTRYKKVIALYHKEEDMVDELEIVIRYGGIIEDVIIEHPIYGEIKANLMIRNLNDLKKFIDRYKSNKAKPLSALTQGIHLHTISTENKDDMDLVVSGLEKAGYLLRD